MSLVRFYQNNEANLECPIASAKPNLDVEKVSFLITGAAMVLMLPVLTVPGSVVHPGVPVPPPDEDGGPQLPHVQVRRRRMLNKRMMIIVLLRFYEDATHSAIMGNFTFRFPPV